MNSSDTSAPSTRPYMIRALHEWCAENGFSPYIAVHVDASVQVPFEFVNNGEIVLNISFDATSALRLGNEFIEFKARFGGVPRDIVVPVTHVLAIYARENGHGMGFPAPEPQTVPSAALALASQTDVDGPARDAQAESPAPSTTPASTQRRPASGRPALKRIK